MLLNDMVLLGCSFSAGLFRSSEMSVDWNTFALVMRVGGDYLLVPEEPQEPRLPS